MTDAELAILSIIAETPLTGSGLQAAIDERGLRAWTRLGTQSVYYLVDKLASQGLIAPNIENEFADPAHYQYHITQAGVGILRTSIMNLLSSPPSILKGFAIGLVNIPALKTGQVENALLNYRSALQQRHKTLSVQFQQLREEKALPFHVISMFEHQLALLLAEMTWFDEWFERWRAQAPDDPEEQRFQGPVSSGEAHPMWQRITPYEENPIRERPPMFANLLIEGDDPGDSDATTTQVNRKTPGN